MCSVFTPRSTQRSRKMRPEPVPALDLPDTPAVLELKIGVSPLAVRHACETIALALRESGARAADLNRIVLVCAEALNNVVEHGGLEETSPPIRLQLTLGAPWHVRILDAGRTMPAVLLAASNTAFTAPACATGDLPEGGFGWRMINSLSDRLDYVRHRGSNRLEIVIDG